MGSTINQKDFEDRITQANLITRNYTLASNIAALVPVAGLDMVTLMGIQLKMLHSLSHLYQIPYSEHLGKSLISSLLGGMFFMRTSMTIASLLKSIPGIGTISGFIGMLTTASASTYAIGKVFIQHFESGGNFLNFDPQAVREHFAAEFDRGQRVISELGVSSHGSTSSFQEKVAREIPPKDGSQAEEPIISEQPSQQSEHEFTPQERGRMEHQSASILEELPPSTFYEQEEHADRVQPNEFVQDNTQVSSLVNDVSSKEGAHLANPLSSEMQAVAPDIQQPFSIPSVVPPLPKEELGFQVHQGSPSKVEQALEESTQEHGLPHEELSSTTRSSHHGNSVAVEPLPQAKLEEPIPLDEKSSHPLSQPEEPPSDPQKHGSLFSFYKDRKKKHH